MRKRKYISMILVLAILFTFMPLQTGIVYADSIEDFYNAFSRKFGPLLQDGNEGDLIILQGILSEMTKSKDGYGSEVNALLGSLDEEAMQTLTNNGFTKEKIQDLLIAINDIIVGNANGRLADMIDAAKSKNFSKLRTEVLEAYDHIEAVLPDELLARSFAQYGQSKEEKAGVLLSLITAAYSDGDKIVKANKGNIKFFIPNGYIEAVNDALDNGVTNPIVLTGKHKRIIQGVVDVVNDKINTKQTTKEDVEYIFIRLGLWDGSGGSVNPNKSSAKEITEYYVTPGQNGTTQYVGQIDSSKKKVNVYVPSNFMLNDFTEHIKISAKATVVRETILEVTANKWKKAYRIKAEDGTEQDYTVIIKKATGLGTIDLSSGTPVTQTITIDNEDSVVGVDAMIDFGNGPSLMMIHIPLGGSETQLTVTIKKAEGVDPSIAAISITIDRGGAPAALVVLTLPVPKGVNTPGAFHLNAATGRWEYRAATLVGGNSIQFTTNLSAVAVAEKVNEPTGLSAAGGVKTATLRWTPEQGMTYEIYNQGGVKLTSGVTINNGTATLTGLSAGTYTFKIRAVNAKNFESALASFPAVTVTTPASSGGGGGGGGSAGKTYSINAEKGGTVETDGLIINIPANALKKDFKITIQKLSRTSDLPIKATMKFLGNVFEITKNVLADFDKAVTITLPFDKSKYDEAKHEIGLFWLNKTTNEWIKLDNIKVDLTAGTVSGEVDHFTKFAVLAIEKDVPVQPIPTPVPSAKIVDISGHWAEANILKLVEAGAISGYPDKTFRPNNNITRAEFATLVVKAFNLEQKTGKVFADTANHWAKDMIATAAAHGIVSGYDQNTFGPNDLITREQMAAMMVKAAKLQATTSQKVFTDQESISAWAKEAVNTAVANDIMGGYPDNSFKPQGKATRAEAVTVVVNALK